MLHVQFDRPLFLSRSLSATSTGSWWSLTCCMPLIQWFWCHPPRLTLRLQALASRTPWWAQRSSQAWSRGSAAPCSAGLCRRPKRERASPWRSPTWRFTTRRSEICSTPRGEEQVDLGEGSHNQHVFANVVYSLDHHFYYTLLVIEWLERLKVPPWASTSRQWWGIIAVK